MESAIQQFNFHDTQPLRVIDRGGDLWFYARDACTVLEIVNMGNAMARLDEDEKDEIRQMDSIGRMQMTPIINEPGLYSLILRSDKPAAKEFKRWITHEVIPAIRKTGAYLAKSLTPAEMLVIMAQRLVDQERALADHDQRLADIEVRQSAIERDTEYFTILAFASREGIRVDNNKSQSLGKHAARYSRKHGYPVGEAPDTRYGHVGTYHIDVLRAVFGVQLNFPTKRD